MVESPRASGPAPGLAAHCPSRQDVGPNDGGVEHLTETLPLAEMLFSELRDRKKRRRGLVLVKVSAPPEGLSGAAGAAQVAGDPNGTLRQHLRNAPKDSFVAAIAGEVGLAIDLPAMGSHGGMTRTHHHRVRVKGRALRLSDCAMQTSTDEPTPDLRVTVHPAQNQSRSNLRRRIFSPLHEFYDGLKKLIATCLRGKAKSDRWREGEGAGAGGRRWKNRAPARSGSVLELQCRPSRPPWSDLVVHRTRVAQQRVLLAGFRAAEHARDGAVRRDPRHRRSGTRSVEHGGNERSAAPERRKGPQVLRRETAALARELTEALRMDAIGARRVEADHP